MPPVAAIAGAAVVGGATSLAAGAKAAKAAKQGNKLAAATADAQIAEERRQYDLDRADWAPYRETGYQALDKLSGMYGLKSGTSALGYTGNSDFTASPGYEFRREEGLRGIDRGLAARGLLNSGGADKARMRYADGLASSEYDTYANRLAALAGVGQSATAATSAAGQAATSGIGDARTQIGNAAVNAGNARASSFANTGSAINGTVNNLASLYLYNQNGGFKSGGWGGGMR
jgi:hypothetical protein